MEPILLNITFLAPMGFKEHRKDFRYAEGKSKFSKHVVNEGHEMKTIEETMSIIHQENNYRKKHT